ncbi:hypothetical protein DCAR_0207198 [Daucus carota subsp. sativus]|uniref:Uncharacterized protein n=1 Tax=Daucus carota subsp. sativus TaxID=79200 RepID=A0AAF0WDL3_DAUCS|nr:hypothetical protein DCAR_0207198 [Daucus carota subsp. sativus]
MKIILSTQSSSDAIKKNGFQTPSSGKHKISKLLSCPIPPRKKPSAKIAKSNMKLEFFEVVGRQEIDSFFKTSFDQIRRSRS